MQYLENVCKVCSNKNKLKFASIFKNVYQGKIFKSRSCFFGLKVDPIIYSYPIITIDVSSTFQVCIHCFLYPGIFQRHFLWFLILCNVLTDDSHCDSNVIGRLVWEPQETTIVRWKLIDCNCFVIVVHS